MLQHGNGMVTDTGQSRFVEGVRLPMWVKEWVNQMRPKKALKQMNLRNFEWARKRDGWFILIYKVGNDVLWQTQGGHVMSKLPLVPQYVEFLKEKSFEGAMKCELVVELNNTDYLHEVRSEQPHKLIITDYMTKRFYDCIFKGQLDAPTLHYRLMEAEKYLSNNIEIVEHDRIPSNQDKRFLHVLIRDNPWEGLVIYNKKNVYKVKLEYSENEGNQIKVKLILVHLRKEKNTNFGVPDALGVGFYQPQSQRYIVTDWIMMQIDDIRFDTTKICDNKTLYITDNDNLPLHIRLRRTFLNNLAERIQPYLEIFNDKHNIVMSSRVQNEPLIQANSNIFCTYKSHIGLEGGANCVYVSHFPHLQAPIIKSFFFDVDKTRVWTEEDWRRYVNIKLFHQSGYVNTTRSAIPPIHIEWFDPPAQSNRQTTLPDPVSNGTTHADTIIPDPVSDGTTHADTIIPDSAQLPVDECLGCLVCNVSDDRFVININNINQFVNDNYRVTADDTSRCDQCLTACISVFLNKTHYYIATNAVPLFRAGLVVKVPHDTQHIYEVTPDFQLELNGYNYSCSFYLTTKFRILDDEYESVLDNEVLFTIYDELPVMFEDIKVKLISVHNYELKVQDKVQTIDITQNFKTLLTTYTGNHEYSVCPTRPIFEQGSITSNKISVYWNSICLCTVIEEFHIIKEYEVTPDYTEKHEIPFMKIENFNNTSKSINNGCICKIQFFAVKSVYEIDLTSNTKQQVLPKIPLMSSAENTTFTLQIFKFPVQYEIYWTTTDEKPLTTYLNFVRTPLYA